MSWENYFRDNPEALAQNDQFQQLMGGLRNDPKVQEAVVAQNMRARAAENHAARAAQEPQPLQMNEHMYGQLLKQGNQQAVDAFKEWIPQNYSEFGNALYSQDPTRAISDYRDHSDRWRAGERDGRGEMFQNRAFLDAISSQVTKGNEGLTPDEYFWAMHSGFQDPEAFQEWSKENPEHAIRFHALAGTGRYDTNSSNWEDYEWDADKHKEYGNALAYQRAQELGYGADGKKDGRVVVGDFNTVDDVSSEGGWGDIWGVGTEQKLTDGIWHLIEENPAETAAVVAAMVAAPYAASALTGLGGAGVTGAGLSAGNAAALANAGAAGITSGAFASAQGQEILPAVLKGFATGGAVSLAAPMAASATEMLGLEGVMAERAGNVLASTAADLAEGDDLYQSLISNLAGEGINAGIEEVKAWVMDGIDAIGETDVFGNSPQDQVARPDPTATASVDGTGPTDASDFINGPTTMSTDGPGALEEVVVTAPRIDTPNLPSINPGNIGVDIMDAARANYEPPSASAPPGPLEEVVVIGERGGPEVPTNTIPVINGLLDNLGLESEINTEGGVEGPEEEGGLLEALLPLLPGLLVGAIGGTEGGGGSDWDGDYRKPQRNFSYRYEKPTYPDAPAQLPLLEELSLGQGGLQAPMVKPARNSGQESYEDWLQRYLREREAAGGLLVSSGGGLL